MDEIFKELSELDIEKIAIDSKFWYGFNQGRFDWLAFAKEIQNKIKEINYEK